MSGHMSDDRSLELLATLRDPEDDSSTKDQAFEELLDLPSGWWGTHPLLRFAEAYALYSVRRILGSRFSADQIDWEGIAVEALLVLRKSAGSIRGSAESWFRGVIKNLVAQEV